jgi:hypothetical protein
MFLPSPDSNLSYAHDNKDEYLICYVWFMDGIDIIEKLSFFERGVKKMFNY